MLKKHIVIAFLLALTFSNFDALAQKTTIWLVRHAEKSTANAADRDPELSDIGTSRAADLAKTLKRENINTVYSTDYKRTRATAAPLTYLLKLTPVMYDTKDLSAIATKAVQENKGKAALIVGHSNTLIPVIKALNCQVPFEELSDDDYDMLFKVVVDHSGNSTLTITHYGELHHSTETDPAKQNKQPAMRTRMTGK
jgi:2,3-bisphosphoglycerate-dependent phosphoglycerate mutase